MILLNTVIMILTVFDKLSRLCFQLVLNWSVTHEKIVKNTNLTMISFTEADANDFVGSPKTSNKDKSLGKFIKTDINKAILIIIECFTFLNPKVKMLFINFLCCANLYKLWWILRLEY